MRKQDSEGFSVKTGNVTRRGFFGRAATTAGVVSAIASGLAPSVAQAGRPAQARITGKLQVVQMVDWHPDHNAFLKKTITDYAAAQRWDLDLSDISGFIGSTDIYQKLQAQKAANQPVDMIMRDLSARILKFFDLTRDASPVVNKMIQKYGQPNSTPLATHQIDGKWIGVPFYDRTGGYFVREDKFAEVGYTYEDGAFETWDSILEACRAVSNPAEPFYGWGMTVNRSGDGESLVRNAMWAWGGALADPTGQIITLFSPETIDAMTWLADVYLNPANADMLPPGVNAWNDLSNNEAYNAGILGFTSNAGTLYATAKSNGNPVADATRLIQQPLGPFGLRLQSSGPHYHYFMNGSRNFDAAAQLSEYLLSEEAQQQLWRISPGYVVPAYRNLWESPIIQEEKISASFMPVALNDPPFQGLAYRGPLTEAADAVGQENVMTDMMGEIIAGKRVDLAVRDAHLRCVQIYQAFGFRGR
ncbi:MAG: carbohydrate ABC transporter substrate-binding protein [Chloroflexi bacterium]|nr:carbohydrate ABC transporter substrate-binding protein [Chloroflexota bacterium]